MWKQGLDSLKLRSVFNHGKLHAENVKLKFRPIWVQIHELREVTTMAVDGNRGKYARVWVECDIQ
jgi:hypothetical protein